MADRTGIEWTDATWNPITACTLVSEGCRNCYAATLAAGRLQHHPSRAGLARRNAAGEARFTGEVRLNRDWLGQPLRWRRPRMIFVCAHGDLFHPAVPEFWIDQVLAVMVQAPQHTFQVLTKRPERARQYLTAIPQSTGTRGRPGPLAWPLPNVHLGTSAEDQETARERVPHLLHTPAATRFLSAEPLLGALDLTRIERDPVSRTWSNALTGYGFGKARLDQVIVGGESGPGARPMHPDWARSLRDQCQSAGVAFFFKQWGSWAPIFERDRDDPSNRHLTETAKATPQGAWLNRRGGPGLHLENPARMVPMSKTAAGRRLDGEIWAQMPRRAA